MFARHWTRTDAPIPEALVEDVEALRHLFPYLAGFDGTGQIENSTDRIVFNGIAPDDHETFALEQDAGWDFCKTGRKHYDVAVAAVLLMAERYGVVTELGSDDGPESFEEGRALMRRATMYVVPGEAA